MTEADLKQRQEAMHIIRGISVLLMVVQHVAIYFGDWDLVYSWRVIWTMLGPNAVAPYFMFIMGVNAADASRATAKQLSVRGLKILGLAYVLNLLRGELPLFVSCHFFDECYEQVYDSWDLALGVDILHFVAGALLFVACFRALDVSNNGILGFSVVLVFVLAMFDEAPESDVTGFFGYFILGTWKMSYFPFRSWIIFPVFGMCIGHYWRPYGEMTMSQRTMNRMMIFSVFFVLVTAPLTILFREDYGFLDFYGMVEEGNYYVQMPLANVFFLCSTLIVLELARYVFKYVPGCVMEFLRAWSRSILAIYVVSWVLIMWCAFAVGLWTIDNVLLLYIIILGSIVVMHLIIRFLPSISMFFKKVFK